MLLRNISREFGTPRQLQSHGFSIVKVSPSVLNLFIIFYDYTHLIKQLVIGYSLCTKNVLQNQATEIECKLK